MACAGTDADQEFCGVLNMFRTIKSATMTYLVSVYIGMIIAGVFMYPTHFTDTYSQLETLYANPIGTILDMVLTAFNGPMRDLILLMLGISALGSVTTLLTGGGFSALFAIPLLLIVSVVNLFVLPTTVIMNDLSMPSEIKFVYSLILSGLLLVTIYSFTAGRQ